LWPEVVEPILPRKASSEIRVPVPQTDTGRRVEYTKAIGRTLVKELGKLAP
jgi:ribosome recycling factor